MFMSLFLWFHHCSVRERLHGLLFLSIPLISLSYAVVQQRCYFRAELNQTVDLVSITVQCWNTSSTEIPYKEQLLLNDILPVLHAVTYPPWSSVVTTAGRHLVTNGNCSFETCQVWTAYVGEDEGLAHLCLTVEVMEATVEQSLDIERNRVTECSNDVDQLIQNIPCSAVQITSCEELRRFSTSSVTVSLVTAASNYYMTFYEPINSTWDSSVLIPCCIPVRQSSVNTVLYWNHLSENVSCSGSGNIQFVPSNIYTSSVTDVFITGNGVVYSTNNGVGFHSLPLPADTNVTSFTILEERHQYVFLTQNYNEHRIWFGIVGTSEVLPIYPSVAMDTVLNIFQVPFQNISLIHWDKYGDLLVETESHVSIPIPLFSMFQEATNNHTFNSSFLHTSSLLGSPYHELVMNTITIIPHNFTCPFLTITIQSPICSKYTRTRLAGDRNLTDQFDQYRLSYSNCSKRVNELPDIVYLPLDGVFVFNVQFSLTYFDESTLHISVKTSSPDIINITLDTTWLTDTNIKEVQVTLRETLRDRDRRQVTSGYTLNKTIITLQVLETGFACAQERLQEQIHIPGIYHLPVRVGCPPGLSLSFDYRESIDKQNHYCESDPDSSCLYFSHEFNPIFKVEDSVTGLKELFEGSYSLQAIAGGTGLHNMAVFLTANIESLLWVKVDSADSNETVFTTSKNGLRWVCHYGSPCGDILPKNGGTPEYYLLLEASNRGFDESYCHFTVRFTVRIHGIATGVVSGILVIMPSLVCLISFLVIGFPLWLWKEKLSHLCDLGKETILVWKNNLDRSVKTFVKRIAIKRNQVAPCEDKADESPETVTE